jgi:hypothetical protein
MQLRFSVLARNRAFSKAMLRVRTKLQPLLDAFEATVLDHPIHEAIVVGITDDKGTEFFEEVENSDGFFQVLSGCSLRGTDDELTEDVFEILHRAVRTCPFATPDHGKFEAMFARLRPLVLGT